MNRFKWTIAVAALMASSVTLASTDEPQSEVQPVELNIGLEPVDSFNFFGRLDNWRAVDRDTLIVWATPFRPYLIELQRPSTDLRFAHVIGISSTVGKVHRGFDEVYIRGWPHQIKAIYRLTPEQARNWKRA